MAADPGMHGGRARAWPSVLVLLGVLMLLRWEPAPLAQAELAVFDALQRSHPRSYRPVPVRIVDVDDASLARLGQWPWPRTRIAQLVERLGRAGAAVIAFDVVFAEPDRTSPGQVVRLWPEDETDPDLRARIESLPDHDRVLAETIARQRVVTGYVLMDHAGGRPPARKAGVSHAGADPARFLPDLLGSVTNLPAIEAAATGNGAFTIARPERDGVVRRAPILFRQDDRIHPSLALEAVRVATGESSYLVRSAGASGAPGFGQSTGITHVRVGSRVTVPTDGAGRVWLHFTPPVPERYVPAWRVLEGAVDPARLEGHLVFVGTSAEGLKDLRATPVDPAMPGVEIHALLAEQMLLGHYLARPDWARGAEALAVLALGGLLIVLLPRLGAAWCAALGLAALAAVVGFSVWAFVARGWLVAPVYASLAVVGTYLTGSLAAFLRTEGERRAVRSAFGRYVSPDVVAELARRPEALRLGGETREMTLLFCDVRGFTTIAEGLDPEALTRLVNRFLTPMTRVILERGGTIDKYMGDCIMAFWNAPLDDPEHARHAAGAALAMERELARLNEEPDVPPLRIGIGLSTGPCCVGNFGSDQRFDYSVIGDEVNLASRLEGQSKTYGVTTVVGEGTAARIPDHALLELDLLRVVGRREPVRVFALLGDPAHADTQEFRALRQENQAFLAAYRARDAAAAEARLARCRRLGPSLEPLWSLHGERLAALRAAPPPADWDAVHDARSK